MRFKIKIFNLFIFLIFLGLGSASNSANNSAPNSANSSVDTPTSSSTSSSTSSPKSSAKTLPVSVKLAEIKAEKTSEKKGDELYFHVTKYSNLGHSVESRIPIFPEHWLSKQLNKVKNVEIWKGSLKEGESIKLIISLLDQDLPPWDADDLLGSAQLMLSNQKGKLKTEWVVPVFEETEEVEMLKPGKPQHYLFKGAGSLYDVAFSVE